MSRMNAPWANSEQFGDALPEFLRSPMTLAMGASILVHGIFFLGLPIVANPGESQDIRPVNVVQLTPQEQAQTPAIDQQPQQPSGLIPNLLSPNGLLNGSPNGLLTPPIPVSPNPSPNVTPFDFSGLPSGSMSQPSYPLPSENYNDSYLRDQLRTAEARLAEARSAEKERLKVVTKPTTAPPTTTPTTTPPTAPIITPPLKLAAANSPEEIAKNRDLYRFDDGSQPESKANPNGTQARSFAWVLSSPKPRENFEKTKSFPATFPQRPNPPVELPYPAATIPLKNYQETILGFSTNPEGTVLDQPEILQSSGYLKLDLAAIEAIKKTPFKKTPNGESFVYRLKFKAPA